MKKCITCGVEKEADAFSNKASSKDGKRNTCKQCASLQGKDYRNRTGPRVKTQRDKERAKEYVAINKDREASRNKQWRQANADKLREYHRHYRETNREAVRERQREWAKKNPDRVLLAQEAFRTRNPDRARQIKASHQAKVLQTIEGRLNARISAHIRFALKTGKGGMKSEALLRWSMADLKEHLERQFTRGMSWHNMGDWHIDHIVPLREFKITGPDCPELRAAWSLTNLRPLWAKDNWSKGGRREHLI